MLIELKDGTQLSPITILGEKRYVHGAHRDTISFVFPKETSLDELDALFTEDNCSKITIFENDNQYVHIGYSIRAELKRESVEITPASAIEEAVYEDRAIISMSQITYAEQQLLLLNEKNAMLEDCIVELAQTIYA